MKEERKRRIRERVGIVTSDRMQKTIVVRVGRVTQHTLFKKTVKKFSKFKAHDEKNEAKSGDWVRIREGRPLSRDKRWRLVEVLKTREAKK